MAQLIALPSDKGPLWVNPDAVSSLEQHTDDEVILHMIGQSNGLRAKGEVDRIAAKLNSVRQREPV